MSRARHRLLAGALLALAMAGPIAAWAVEAAVVAAPAASEPKIGPIRKGLRGLASWYGAHFHGRRTASGALFDENALTAAHPTLPFGTLVEVRNLATGRVVEVRINDRGPYTGRRVIDLSEAAAQAIGLGQGRAGTAQVSLTVLDTSRAAVLVQPMPPAAGPAAYPGEAPGP